MRGDARSHTHPFLYEQEDLPAYAGFTQEEEATKAAVKKLAPIKKQKQREFLQAAWEGLCKSPETPVAP